MGTYLILLTDDHGVILVGVLAEFSVEFEVVVKVNNGLENIAEVERLDPDVLVIDISMPMLDGLQAVSRLGSNCRTKVVFLTVHEDPDFVAAAFSAGASGYVV